MRRNATKKGCLKKPGYYNCQIQKSGIVNKN